MKIYQGYVTANGGNTPRPATAITYSIVVDYGGSVGVVDYTGITPNGQRPDPATVDAIPRPVGYPFLVGVAIDGAQPVAYFEETPAYAVCSSPSTPLVNRNVFSGGNT